MKKIMITLAGALMALATHAQSVLLVETEKGSTQYVYGKNAEVSFWGLPEGDEANRDLIVDEITVYNANITNFQLYAANSPLFDDVGICVTEKEHEEPEYVQSAVGGYTYYSITYSATTPYYSLKAETDDNDYAWKGLEQLQPGKTYYVKPYVVSEQEVLFGSEKAFTTMWTIQSLLTNISIWYQNVEPVATNGEFIVPNEAAWESFCAKYKEYLGEEPSDVMKQALTTAWFRHLTPAEASLMKANSVAYYDNCMEGDVYVVDKVCDDFIPSMLKSVQNIDLTRPNLEAEGETPLYTKYGTVETVECDAVYGIEGNSYVKVVPAAASINPTVGYDFPSVLLPNHIYNVSVTIAPDTESAEDALPNKFQVQIFNYGKTAGTKIANPATSTEENADYTFIYGGQKLETFTFQIDTHDEAFAAPKLLQLQSNLRSRETNNYSRTLRIAKITVSTVMEDAVPGDADLDGTVNQDDVETVAAAVVLGNDNNEETPEEQHSTDFTGDGKTLIDDVVALVNYIQTGEFQPTSSKARVRRATATAPAFTTEKSLTITTGENTTLNVDMSGMADYTAVSFDIKVPQGVRIASDENGKPKVALGNMATAKHNAKTAMQEDGQTISVACFAEDNASFAKNAGTILTVELTVDSDIASNNEAQISLANCMATQRTLSSALLDEYTINAGIVNGIEEIRHADNPTSLTIVAYYTLNGTQIAQPQRGINLVRMSDGSVKKLLVK